MIPAWSVFEILTLTATALPIAAYGFLIFTFWRNFPTKQAGSHQVAKSTDLSLSVIIPYKNEAENLPQLLNALEKQTATKVEYLFVNDHSSDHSTAFLSNYSKQSQLHIRLIENTGVGKKNAIITGVSESSSEHTVLTDADVEPLPTWLADLAESIAFEQPYLLVNVVTTNVGKNFAEKFQELDFLSLVAVTFGARNNPIMCNAANLYFRKSIFLALNPYQTNLHIPTGDDIFLLQAFKKHFPDKISFNTNPATWVNTNVKQNWQEFLEQRIRWGSKTINYSDRFAVMVAALVLFYPIAILVTLVLSFVYSGLWKVLLALIVFKWIVDSLLLIKACNFFKKTYLIRLILPTLLIQLVYYPLAAFWGLIRNLRTFKK